VGEPLGAELVQGLVPRADLAEEERRGTIVAEESGRRAEVRLAHPLFGEVLRARMPVLQRRRLQRLLADALEATGSLRRGDVLRLATWRVESASAVDAGLLLRAARRAREVFDFALAARLAEAAWELAPSFEAGLLHGASLSGIGRFGAAAEVLDRLAGTEPDETAGQLLARERAWAMFHGPGGFAAARRVLEEAEASAGDPVRRLLARADLAQLLVFSGRSAEALAIGGPLIAPAIDVRYGCGPFPRWGRAWCSPARRIGCWRCATSLPRRRPSCARSCPIFRRLTIRGGPAHPVLPDAV
jgi:hypothetical protein